MFLQNNFPEDTGHIPWLWPPPPIHIEAGVNAPILLANGREVAVRLSMGICRVPEDDVQDPGNLLRYADQALYRAKAIRNERSHYRVFHRDPRLDLRPERRAGLFSKAEEER